MIRQRELVWSEPKRRALEVFFLNQGRAYRSNSCDVERALAYWSAVDWLAEHDLIKSADGRGRVSYEWQLTERGWSQAARLWNVPAATVAKMKGGPL